MDLPQSRPAPGQRLAVFEQSGLKEVAHMHGTAIDLEALTVLAGRPDYASSVRDGAGGVVRRTGAGRGIGSIAFEPASAATGAG